VKLPYLNWCHQHETREDSGPSKYRFQVYQLQTVFFVLLALVDARYKFRVVYIGLYGRNSDGGIFAHTKLGKYLETHLSSPEAKQLPGHHA
jgi:hypothetical protein